MRWRRMPRLDDASAKMVRYAERGIDNLTRQKIANNERKRNSFFLTIIE